MDVIKSTFIDLACLSSLLEGAVTLRLNGNEWLAKSWSSAACPQETHQESSRCVSAGGSDIWAASQYSQFINVNVRLARGDSFFSH